MSKLLFVFGFLFIILFAIHEGNELEIRNNLKPIAEYNCLQENKTFTGFGINKDFYYCNGERRGFLLKELEDASHAKGEQDGD